MCITGGATAGGADGAGGGSGTDAPVGLGAWGSFKAASMPNNPCWPAIKLIH